MVVLVRGHGSSKPQGTSQAVPLWLTYGAEAVIQSDAVSIAKNHCCYQRLVE